MPRNSLGRFTARRSRRTGRLSPGPVEGTETDGIVSGPTVTLGAEPPAPKASKSSASTSSTT